MTSMPNAHGELPEDWAQQLQIGYGKPLTEEQFKALMKSRQESNPSQKPPVVFDYPMPAANDATGKTDTPQRSGQ